MRLPSQTTVEKSYEDAFRKAKKAVADGDKAAFLRQVERLGSWGERDQSAYGEWDKPDIRPLLQRGAKVFFGGEYHWRMAQWFSPPGTSRKGVKRVSGSRP